MSYFVDKSKSCAVSLVSTKLPFGHPPEWKIVFSSTAAAQEPRRAPPGVGIGLTVSSRSVENVNVVPSNM